MAEVEFYNVKKRKKVKISSGIKKVKYERKVSNGVQVRYAVKAVDDDGTSLTKFCSKADWDAIDAPEA